VSGAALIGMNPGIAADEKLLTVADVAAWLQVSAKWVRAHAAGERRPVLKSLKIGKERRFRREDVEEYLIEAARRAEYAANRNTRRVG
jgi:excisionase family DNA binding protein